MSKNFCLLHIRNGKIENPGQVKKLFDQLRDGKWLLEIAKADKRSDQANRYYWGLVIPLVQNGIRDLGTELTKEETHEFLKAKFNYQEVVNNDGVVENIPLSTTRLNRERFSDYLAKIQQFSAEFLNVVIPDPGQQLEIEV